LVLRKNTLMILKTNLPAKINLKRVIKKDRH
jgi:hypothetical protein